MKPKHITTLLFFLLSITAFTPAQMYDEQGNLTWEADLDIYGKVRNFAGRSLNECPFRFQGQYENSETGLYYNRFRYYDPENGNYISQDPIRLCGNNPTFYGYVKDPNSWLDPLGLNPMNPANIRFSQDSISPVFSNGGGNISDLINNLKANPDIMNTIPEIKVVKLESLPDNIQIKLKGQGAPAGSVFSLDNRRLYAAQQANLPEIKTRWATADDLAEINLDKRFSTENAGTSVRVRCKS
jgi:RHS repeat-associated protein